MSVQRGARATLSRLNERFLALDRTEQACMVSALVAGAAGFAASCAAEGIRYPRSDSLESQADYLMSCQTEGRTPRRTEQTGDAATAASLLFFLANGIGASQSLRFCRLSPGLPCC